MHGDDTIHPAIDNPIDSAAKDLLERAPVARQFIRDLLRIDPSAGVVAAIMAPWGHGKSSFINLMKEELKSDPVVTVVDFNPWLFSGTQQLTEFFFSELASQLELKGGGSLDSVARLIRDYSDVLSPLAIIPFLGGWLDRAIRALRAIAALIHAQRETSAADLRTRISAELGSLDQPIVVVIDDIDRLGTEEVRDIFRLVRLTASFPNLIYVLAFDRTRVEAALAEGGVSGRAYLEKIVQLGFDIPSTPKLFLRRRTLIELDQLIEDLPDVRFSNERWPDVYAEVIEPLIGSLRDVARLVSSARFAVSTLGHEIDIVDIIALETIRVFQPTLFERIKDSRDLLTSTLGYSLYGDRPRTAGKTRMEEILALSDLDERPLSRDVIHSVLARVFPAGEQYTSNMSYGSDFSSTWRRNHRVAHIDFLNLYLERVAPSGMVALRSAEAAIAALPDPNRFAQFVEALAPEELKETLAAFELYEGEYPREGIVAGCLTLLAAVNRIPPSKGMFDLDGSTAVARVVVRMLKSIPELAQREAAIAAVIDSTDIYSAKFVVIRLLKEGKEPDSRWTSEEFADQARRHFAEEVAEDEPTRPEDEWDLLRVYYFAQTEGYTVDASSFSPSAAWALISSAKGQNHSQVGDSRVVHTKTVLAWEPLVEFFGSEDPIRQTVDAVRGSASDGDLIELVDRYLAGWRPRDDDDTDS